LRELFEVTGERPTRENVVVVQYAGQKAGIVVDQLLGEFQTVIKPLGSTILGSSRMCTCAAFPGGSSDHPRQRRFPWCSW
jgi:chemotaxis protein histidine kinase CheA